MTAFEILGFTGVLLTSFAWVVWMGWVRDHLRHCGQQPRSPLLGLAPVWDAENAGKIAKESERTPWFLTLYRVLMIAGLLCVIAATACLFLAED